MFKKLAYFCDIHFGRGLNNPDSLQDNQNFVDWFIDEALSRGCETFIFGGDWYDNRHSINVLTLDSSRKALEKISKAFKHTYMLLGNHDLVYRSNRSISSVTFAKHLPNITIIDQPTVIGDVTLLPWLVGNEQQSIANQGRYTFAHLEMAGFLMNAKVAKADGEDVLRADAFSNHEFVFTGHFHMRQIVKNIIYTGNVMPFDFSDAWDEDRGAMFLNHGGLPEFVAWPDQPLFRTMKLSQMLDSPSNYLKPRLVARVFQDIDISYEESQVIKDTFIADYALRKMELIPVAKQDLQVDFGGNVVCKSVDQIVVEGLSAVQSSGLDPAMLIQIYTGLGNTGLQG